MLAGLRDILIILLREDTPRFEQLLGDGKEWGINLQYCGSTESQDGLAQAFIIGKDFLDGCPSALVLGDNIFHGHDLHVRLESAMAQTAGATVFAYHVHDPDRYGVVAFDAKGKGHFAGRKTEGAEIQLCSDGFVLLRQAGCRYRRRPEAFGTW